MKKNLKIRKLLILGLVSSFVTSLNCTCKFPSREVLRASSEGQLTFYVAYLEKEIEVSSSGNPNPDRFFLRNGEFFDARDSTLFFSILRDTSMDMTSYGLHYRIIIERLKDGQYRTSNYFLRNPTHGVLLSSFTYDSKYHISQIKRYHTVVFK